MGSVGRHPLYLALAAFILMVSCGEMDCAYPMQPLDRDLDERDKVYDGVLLEISPGGFQFITEHFEALADTFLPEGLYFEMPPDPDSSCPSWCSGQRLCHQDAPCPFSALLENIEILRGVSGPLMEPSPSTFRLEADLFVHSGLNALGPADEIPVLVCDACIPFECDFRLHMIGKRLGIEIELDIDPITHALTFSVSEPRVEVTNKDYTISGGLVCWVAENLFKGFLTSMINNMLAEQVVGAISETIDEMTCMPCDYFSLGCAGVGHPDVFCDPSTERCASMSGTCVRAPMGFAGKVDVADLLADTSVSSVPIGVHAGVGQRLGPHDDPFLPYPHGPLRLRGITGAAAELDSPCVPLSSSVPDTAPPPRLDFLAEAGSLDYHVGLAVSQRFLNKALFELYRSGGLCLNVGTEVSEIISTGLLSALLPSVGVLADSRGAPMFVASRPKDRPRVNIGLGTYRMEGNRRVVDDPLLELLLDDVVLDFYAFVEGRYFRLFGLELDLVIPFNLETANPGELIPVVGDLENMVRGIDVRDSEILAEDPALLIDIIPVVISIVEPLLAEVLEPILVPDIQGFRLEEIVLKGAVPGDDTTGYEHLALFARLGVAEREIPVVEASPSIEITYPGEPRQGVPGGLRLGTWPPSFPRVEVRDGLGREVEWQYRVNGGFWSPFQPSTRMEIASPVLRSPGRHLVEIRTRLLDTELAPSDVVGFEVLVDPPSPSP